jgi:hypothetical protein
MNASGAPRMRNSGKIPASEYFGADTIQAGIDRMVQQREGKAERAIRAGELKLGEAQLPIREGELAVRREEVGLQKTREKIMKCRSLPGSDWASRV